MAERLEFGSPGRGHAVSAPKWREGSNLTFRTPGACRPFRVAPAERHSFKYENRTVYEWDQTFGEVNIYIQVPQGVRAKQLDVAIASTHLAVGIKGNPPYLEKDLGGAVKVSESVWTLEDDTLHIELAKAQGGETWAAALAGHELGAAQQAVDQKRLMLERFQAEHPGFDFSGAEFTGEVPDPRTFLRDLD